MPEPSGSQSKQPPPSPRPAAGSGSVVSIRSGPPSAATTTIADEPPIVATNATDEPSGDSFGSVSSRPATHISGVMSGGRRFVGAGTIGKIRGTCHTKLTCVGSRARGTMWFPRPERRCTDDDEQCQCTSPLRRARRLWTHRLTRTRREQRGARTSAHVSRQASATIHEIPGARSRPDPTKGTVMYTNSCDLKLMLARDRQEELRRIDGRSRLRYESRRHRRRRP